MSIVSELECARKAVKSCNYAAAGVHYGRLARDVAQYDALLSQYLFIASAFAELVDNGVPTIQGLEEIEEVVKRSMKIDYDDRVEFDLGPVLEFCGVFRHCLCEDFDYVCQVRDQRRRIWVFVGCDIDVMSYLVSSFALLRRDFSVGCTFAPYSLLAEVADDVKHISTRRGFHRRLNETIVLVGECLSFLLQELAGYKKDISALCIEQVNSVHQKHHWLLCVERLVGVTARYVGRGAVEQKYNINAQQVQIFEREQTVIDMSRCKGESWVDELTSAERLAKSGGGDDSGAVEKLQGLISQRTVTESEVRVRFPYLHAKWSRTTVKDGS